MSLQDQQQNSSELLMKQTARQHRNVKCSIIYVSCSRHPAPVQAANPSLGRGDNANHITSISVTYTSVVLKDKSLGAHQILNNFVGNNSKTEEWRHLLQCWLRENEDLENSVRLLTHPSTLIKQLSLLRLVIF